LQEENKAIQVVRDLWNAPGLREKIFWTLGMILVFRLIVHVPIAGINQEVLNNLFANMNFLGGFLDFFSGGALAKFSVVAMGITPYINASIIMQLMTGVIPKLEELQKEGGEAGRKQIQQYTRYLMLVLATVQSFGMASWLWRSGAAIGIAPAGPYPWFFIISTVTILVSGSCFIMWLGEVITERGIGNGASLMIFAGIIAAFPTYIVRTTELVAEGGVSAFAVTALVLAMLGMLVAIVFVQEGQRRIPVQAAKRGLQGGGRGAMQQSYIPLKVNMGGVMPLIFASSLMIFPATIGQFLGQSTQKVLNWQFETSAFWQWDNFRGVLQHGINQFMAALTPSGYLYFIVTFVLIMFFTYFYASLVLNPSDLAENLKKYGSFVPGYKPGKPTADFIEQVLNRITFAGGVFLGLIATLPMLVERATGVTTLQGLGSTALLIMVGVAIDLYNQLQTHLIARQYEGFMS
jgi:preprotein translocase subunit SecY